MIKPSQLKSRTISNDAYAETSLGLGFVPQTKRRLRYDVERNYTVNGLNQYSEHRALPGAKVRRAAAGPEGAAISFTYDGVFVSYRFAV